ncbi:hypothetical protein [Paenisporosarcina sp. TG20]|nr:hypothetical protein [Paenisporosarcina sp. TG20]
MNDGEDKEATPEIYRQKLAEFIMTFPIPDSFPNLIAKSTRGGTFDGDC